ncbi:hypothetical protein HN873_018582, partial [Arachis hypogaea]
MVGQEQIRAILMQLLSETNRCRDILRMGPDAFLQLCEKLKVAYQVRDTKQVASRDFLAVLGSIILLEEEFLRQPSAT